MRQIAIVIGTVLAIAQMPVLHAQRSGNTGSQTPSTSKPAAPSTQKPAAPSTQKPTPRPAPTTKPAPPAPAATAKAEPPAPAAPPPPQDARFKVVYRADGAATETTIYAKGERQRYEFTDMVLLQQHDLKRTIQISLSAKTYYVTPDPDQTAGVGASQTPPANIRLVTTIVDTGERKTLFGREARRVKTMIDKQPMPGACDATKQRIETDGWYVDPPAITAARQDNPMASMAGNTTCQDVIAATVNGDPKLLGFPMTYTTSVAVDAGAPSTVAMEVTEFELTTLDAALFDVPPGLNAALNLGEMGKAVSDANETKLAAMNAAPPAAPVARTPGAVRVGVVELTNKTDQRIDTRALRTQLATSLEASKIETMPLAAATPEELQKRAAAQGLAYVILAEVTELKVSKPGGLGGALRAATGALNAKPGETPKLPTEASLNVRVIQAADGKQRMSKSVKGNNGGGLAGAGLGAAKLAGGVAGGMLMGPRMLAQMYRLNSAFGPNLGGFGLLGTPSFFRLQTMSLGVGGYGGGRIDRAAGAAAFMMEQSAAMSAAASAVPPGATSFEDALAEALDKATKEIVGALPKN